MPWVISTTRKNLEVEITLINMKSFYDSAECVDHGLNPLHSSLCVISHADSSTGLILDYSPVFKKVFGKSNVGCSYNLSFDIKTRKFKTT